MNTSRICYCRESSPMLSVAAHLNCINTSYRPHILTTKHLILQEKLNEAIVVMNKSLQVISSFLVLNQQILIQCVGHQYSKHEH